MTTTTLAILLATVFFAAFVHGSTGLGFALIVVPVLGLLAPQELPVCVLIMMLPLNCYVAWRERAGLDLRSGGFITSGRIVGTLGGLWVLGALSTGNMNMLIGISTIAAVAITLLMPAFKPTASVYVVAGLVTGVTETATGIGGPPLALVYQHHPPPVMRSTIAFCLLVGELISLAFLWYSGRAEGHQLLTALQLTPALIAGALLSRLAHHRINGLALRTFVMLFSIGSAVALLLNT